MLCALFLLWMLQITVTNDKNWNPNHFIYIKIKLVYFEMIRVPTVLETGIYLKMKWK